MAGGHASIPTMWNAARTLCAACSTRASRFRWSIASAAPTARTAGCSTTAYPRYGADGSFAGYIGSAIDITERSEMEQSLLDSEAALRRAYEQNQDLAGRLINAQEEERTRIARDLHDDVSQQIAGIGILLSGLKRKLGGRARSRRSRRRSPRLQERTSTLADAIRHLSHELHPGMLQARRSGRGAEAALRRDRPHHGLAVKFSAPDELRRARVRRRALSVPGDPGGARERRPARPRHAP